MPALTPTRREIWLALALLTGLLILGRLSFDFGRKPSVLSLWSETAKEKPISPADSPLSVEIVTDEGEARTTLFWGSKQIPETRIVAHVPGWTMFDNLYILNGTMYVVTDRPETAPNRTTILSKGIPMASGEEARANRLPTDKQMRIVSTKEAKKLLGMQADIMDGVSWLAYDPAQFVTHYYHWSAELFFGFWRTYSSLDPLITANGTTVLPPPRRMVFPHLDAAHWRDYAAMNQWVLRSAFPTIAFEFSADWNDRIEMNRPFVFDRVILADRSAATMGHNYGRTQRTASETFYLPGSVHWWSTIRKNVIESTGMKSDVGHGSMHTPVITYISRQEWGRRMLKPEHHDKLVQELHRLRDTYGYEVNVVSMDKLSRIEQFQLAARTTIMMGVHGNGLTALVWMKPTPRTTIMEFFYPGGFAHDYEYTARALGMLHYGFWGSEMFTSPRTPPPAYPPGFQGNDIPIDGELVARLVHDRLTLVEESDD